MTSGARYWVEAILARQAAGVYAGRESLITERGRRYIDFLLPGLIGANVMGKRMFEEGESSWPEEAPFHTQVFVLTHEVRAPWERKGGTTFHFVNDGIETALRRAREAAGEKDVRISGGGATVLQYLNAGLVDELLLSLAPTFHGGGVRL